MESGMEIAMPKKLMARKSSERHAPRHTAQIVTGMSIITVIIILAIVSLLLQNANNQKQIFGQLNSTPENNESKIEGIEVPEINCINAGDTGNSRYQADYHGRISNNLDRTAGSIIIRVSFLDSSGKIIGFDDNSLLNNLRAGESRSFEGTAINLLEELASCKATVEYS